EPVTEDPGEQQIEVAEQELIEGRMCCKPIEEGVVVADDNGIEAPFLIHVGVEDRQRPMLLQALE
ncbi:hypothetical protein ACJX0J_041867, partial [Zea mays]